jgi:hypothetical protein
VKGSAPSETEEEPIRSFSARRAGNVGAPAILDSFAPTVEKKVDVCTPGSTGTMDELAAIALDRSHGREKTEPQEGETKHGPRKKKRRYACRLCGAISLKDGAV